MEGTIHLLLVAMFSSTMACQRFVWLLALACLPHASQRQFPSCSPKDGKGDDALLDVRIYLKHKIYCSPHQLLNVPSPGSPSEFWAGRTGLAVCSWYFRDSKQWRIQFHASISFLSDWLPRSGYCHPPEYSEAPQLRKTLAWAIDQPASAKSSGHLSGQPPPSLSFKLSTNTSIFGRVSEDIFIYSANVKWRCWHDRG